MYFKAWIWHKVALAKVRLLARDMNTRNPEVLICGHLLKEIALARTATVVHEDECGPESAAVVSSSHFVQKALTAQEQKR